MLELRCFRWVQVSKLDVQSLIDDQTINLLESHHYVDSVGKDMFEFHVDTAKELSQFIRGKNAKRMGGNMSVRKPVGSKPVIMVGQDEAIFHQNALRRKQWVLPDGSRELLPKSDGDAIMASLFVNREDGIFQWTYEFVQKVNEQRAGQHYTDRDSARGVIKSGDTQKQPLTIKDHPCVQYFEVGVGYEGYWNYAQMAIQFEGVVDCYKVLYPVEEYE